MEELATQTLSLAASPREEVEERGSISNPDQIPCETHFSGIDYRYPEDDSWWPVELVLEEDYILTLKYVGLHRDFDEIYKPINFNTPTQLNQFTHRFRPTTQALSDHECQHMTKGTAVCAYHEISKQESRNFDAEVDFVDLTSHGKEQCTCTFHLIWKQGPYTGKNFSTGGENISLLQPGVEVENPILNFFLKLCRRKFEVAQDQGEISFGGDNLVGEYPTRKSKSVECCRKARWRTKRKVRKARIFKAKTIHQPGRLEEDTDLGGISRPAKNLLEATKSYTMMVENLEKDLTPSVIVDFIIKHILISSQVQMFPKSPSEVNTKGIITVASQDELQKLSDFLNDPAHMILSSRGRPWVISENQSWFETVRGNVGISVVQSAVNFKSQPSVMCLELGNELELVSWGTVKYKRGKLLRELYMELVDHQRGLYEKLALEESKILQSDL